MTDLKVESAGNTQPPPGSEGDTKASASSAKRRAGTGSVTRTEQLNNWVALAQSGDEEAMHQVVLEVMPRVRNGVRYLVRGDAIDDLVQDVLVTLLRRLNTFQGIGRFESWVDGVTLRVVIGGARKLRKNERRWAAADGEEIAMLRQPERYATSRQLVGALDQLPQSQRQALVLHHVFGLTIPESAQKQGVPVETVRSRLRAGMGQARALLGVPQQEKGGVR